MKINLVGPSYVYPSLNFDTQRAINFYPAQSETGTSKSQFILCPTPGRVAFATLPVQPIRGAYNTATRAFVVAYNTLYEIESDGTYTSRGTLDTYAGNVSMADNGLQVMIVDGTADGGYIFTLATDAFQKISDGDFEGGVTVCFIGGYFLVNRPGTAIYQISALYDGLAWDATEFANAEGSPDDLVAVVTVHQQVFLFGSNTTQVGYNSGDADFPISNVGGVFIEYGCSAAFSVQQTANTVFWVGNDKSGANVVWMAEGYQPKRVSTEAIENYIRQYDLSNMTSYSYQENGHYFYIINIEGAPTSLVYDITMGQWHERARWNVNSGRYERDHANFHMFVFGKHLVSDFDNGQIYEQSLDYLDDDGTIIRRARIFPYFSDDLKYLYFKSLQVDMQTGVGLIDGNDEDVDPQAALRWSDDGGHTWSSEIYSSIGKIGQYFTRCIWRRLGRGRFRAFEVVIAARVKCYLIGAELEVEKGLA